jgi:phage FluMu gp28-like protein
LASQPDKGGYFLPYQERWLADRSRLKIAQKSRRIGWTYVQSYEDCRDAVRADGGMDVWFSSADQSAAEEYIRYCERWIKMFDAAAKSIGECVIDSERSVKALVIELSNGKRINALTSNPKRFRSKGGKVVLDEYAFHDDQDAMWRAASPAITWGYPLRVISTHNGRSCRYYRMVSDAEKAGPKSKWSLHTVTIVDAVNGGLVDKIKGRPATEDERQAFLEECREIAGDQETFDEEFMCIARDGTLAWLDWSLITSCESEDAGRPELYQGGPCFVGRDIARRGDFAIQWVSEQVGDVLWTREIVELRNASFAAQDLEYSRLVNAYRVIRGCFDQTGMGEKVVEDAQRMYGRYAVEGVLFNGPVKQELATAGRQAFEDRKVRIPPSRIVRESHHSVRRVVTAAGNPRFDADRNEAGHADHFWGHMLAIHGAATPAVGRVDFTPAARRRFTTAGAY